MLTCFLLMKSQSCYVFTTKIIVANFLHLMMLFNSMIINHASKRQSVELLYGIKLNVIRILVAVFPNIWFDVIIPYTLHSMYVKNIFKITLVEVMYEFVMMQLRNTCWEIMASLYCKCSIFTALLVKSSVSHETNWDCWIFRGSIFISIKVIQKNLHLYWSETCSIYD